MNISFDAFKKLSKEFIELSKLVKSASLGLAYVYDANYHPVYRADYTACVFENVAKMHAYAKLREIVLACTKVLNYQDSAWWREVSYGTQAYGRTLDEVTSDTSQYVKTLKLVPTDTPTTYRPKVLRNAPVEMTEGDYTYRFVTEFGKNACNNISIIARNDEPLYDYLDKGFYLKTVTIQKKNGDYETVHIVANQYDVNVAHIFAMCELHPAMAEFLRDGCFINVYEAELLRLKMHKKLPEHLKLSYAAVSRAIDDDYRKNTTLLVAGKLMNGDIDKTVINNITLTKTSATYERVSIEADNLLEVLYQKLNFNSEFDIYTITDAYARHAEAALTKEREDMAYAGKEAAKETASLNEHDAQLEAEDEEAPSTLCELPTFKINGIDITPSVSSTYQRYINKIRINKEEISKAIHRASCHHSANDYRLFLKSICRMSIKWHDIIANGLPVKIHSTITAAEYSKEEASINAPALKFSIDKAEKCIKLLVGSNRSVKISLAKLVKKVESLNKRTDNGWVRSRDWANPYGYRSFGWCQHALVSVLIEASTFTVKSVDAENKPVETKQVLLTKEDIVKLLDVANEAKKAAIEKSKAFLETAVKLTKAETVDFMGERAYKVAGSLRTYAVVIKNAKVYDFETKQYRCIVNDRHYAGAGYDDLAARLLALKNDSVMQDKIGTLRGASGQPGAEHAHDHEPERDDVPERLEETINRALASV